MPHREDVFNALLALVQANVTGPVGEPIKKYTRRMTLPASVDPGDLPCLMLWDQPEQTDDPGIGTPSKRTWECVLVLVVRNPDKQTPGATYINQILDQTDIIPEDQSTDIQTLGGLVSWVKIIGRTIKETGDTDPNGLGGFVLPIKILVP